MNPNNLTNTDDGHGNKSTENRDFDFWMAEYASLATQFATLLGIYVKIFIIYAGILGFALKFALDADSTPELRWALRLFALVVCGFYVLINLAGVVTTIQLQRRRQEALENLGKTVESEFRVGYWASSLTVIFNVIAIVGWWGIN